LDEKPKERLTLKVQKSDFIPCSEMFPPYTIIIIEGPGGKRA